MIAAKECHHKTHVNSQLFTYVTGPVSIIHVCKCALVDLILEINMHAIITIYIPMSGDSHAVFCELFVKQACEAMANKKAFY